MGSYICDCWDSGVRMYIQTGTVDCPSGHRRCFRSDDREFSGCALVLQSEGRRSVNTRIKELRARYNLTQEELAKKVGVRRETIVFLEKGKYNPSLKLAHDVAKVLETTIEELFIFDDD